VASRRGVRRESIAARARVLLRCRAAMQSSEPNFTNPRRPAREGKLVAVGRVEDLPEGRGATVELDGGGELALYHVGGHFYAVENFCPHKGAPLADGNLFGHEVECDWHGWRFDLRTGACLNRPCDPVETYEVIIEDGWIKIRT
jgi:nitrite reductase/ring-hydroxylating ferredoxin subunit